MLFEIEKEKNSPQAIAYNIILPAMFPVSFENELSRRIKLWTKDNSQETGPSSVCSTPSVLKDYPKSVVVNVLKVWLLSEVGQAVHRSHIKSKIRRVRSTRRIIIVGGVVCH